MSDMENKKVEALNEELLDEVTGGAGVILGDANSGMVGIMVKDVVSFVNGVENGGQANMDDNLNNIHDKEEIKRAQNRVIHRV